MFNRSWKCNLTRYNLQSALSLECSCCPQTPKEALAWTPSYGHLDEESARLSSGVEFITNDSPYTDKIADPLSLGEAQVDEASYAFEFGEPPQGLACRTYGEHMQNVLRRPRPRRSIFTTTDSIFIGH